MKTLLTHTVALVLGAGAGVLGAILVPLAVSFYYDRHRPYTTVGFLLWVALGVGIAQVGRTALRRFNLESHTWITFVVAWLLGPGGWAMALSRLFGYA